MKEKVVISLNRKEQIELEEILTDEDKDLALKFLKEVLRPKVLKASHEGCKPTFEWPPK